MKFSGETQKVTAGDFMAQQTLSSAQISVPHGSGPSVPPSAPGTSGGVKSHLCADTGAATAAGDEQQDSEDCSKRHFHPPGSQTLNRWPPLDRWLTVRS